MEGRKKESKPCYKRELSIYEKETLKKIEEFRSARSNWIADSAGSKIHLKVNEGLKDSNAYQGRNEHKTFYEDDRKLDATGSRAHEMRGLRFLRKFKISTKNMRLHYKTLRPLKYYTLRPQLPYMDAIDAQAAKQEKQEQQEQRKHKYTCSDLELWPTEEPPANLKVKPAKKKKLKRKRAKCKELLMPVPCRQALKKLKAAKLQAHMIESCRCDDGKEVTVVIKGICLCDKNSLNNLKLDKVCDKYSQMVATSDKDPKPAQEKVLSAQEKGLSAQEKGLPASERQENLQQKVESKPQDTGAAKVQNISQESIYDEKVTIRAVSSTDIHKQRIKSRKESNAPKREEKEKILKEEKSKKSVGFDKEEYNKPEEKRKITDSDLTIYPRFSTTSFDSTAEEPKPDDTKMKTGKQENKTEVSKTKPEKDMPKEQNVSEVTEIVRDDGVNRVNQDTKIEEETSAKDLRRGGVDNENASTITLYKNTPEKGSDFALTPEQMKVIKENENKEK